MDLKFSTAKSRTALPTLRSSPLYNNVEAASSRQYSSSHRVRHHHQSSLISGAGSRKRGRFGGQSSLILLLRWLNRPSTFVLTAVCLLLAPSVWFFTRMMHQQQQAPATAAEATTAAAAAAAAVAGTAPLTLPPPPVVLPPPRPPPTPVKELPYREPGGGVEEVPKITSVAGRGTGDDGRDRQERPRQKPDPVSSWKPPVLPVEVVRDVPPEECLRNPLWDKVVDESNYEFGCDEIEEMMEGEKTLIGNGNIRDVYLVERGGRKLVVKYLREDFEQRASRSRVEKIHRWEAAAIDAVRGHPNVVDLVGICGPSSVSEYFAVRLDDLVLKAGAQPIPILTVVSMALDAARGLQALHEAPGGAIVHFDMKPQQFMVDDQGRLKINDLNMCSFTDADADGNTCPYESAASRVGPWRSPENIAGEKLNEKLDIYSLAMVFYSMLALDPPYLGVPNASGNIKDGIPPPTDPSWHPGFLDIVRDMWQRDPNARPSARRVVQRLEFLRDHLATQATS